METEAATNWPEAIVALSAIVTGTLMVTVIVTVVAWQLFSSWRARMSVAREQAYQQLAQEAVAAQRAASEGLRAVADDLAELRERTAEIERMLREVG